MKFCLILLIVFVSSCATHKVQNTVIDCRLQYANEDVLEQLDSFSELFQQKCFNEAIQLGKQIRKNYRDKYFSVTKEIGEVFVGEGAFNDYTLESYERSYLSYLMAIGYLNLGEIENAKIELRKSAEENSAVLYNYGDDPVILVLQATLWEKLNHPAEARPFWRKAFEHPNAEPSLKSFCKTQIDRIDRKEKVNWKIRGVSDFPAIDWEISGKKMNESYYSIYAKNEFPPVCKSNDSLVINTETWMNKIKIRHFYDYHPILNVKTWTRMPVGLAYGAGLFASGVAVTVGTCFAAAYAHATDLCQYSYKAGSYFVNKSEEVFQYTVAPDLRHWKRVPAGFYLSSQANSKECDKYGVVTDIF
jgi:hypothetical protein